MFTTVIVQPIFNLLVLIYGLIPGHNFGLSIIIFTIIIRLLLWPLLKKQLHQAKAMRELQPELKRIKKEAAGDRQKESMLVMELYKEREINPFGSIGVILLQLPILIGLYSGLNRVVHDPKSLVDFSYPVLQQLPWMKELAGNIHLFDKTLFGVVDLTKAALGSTGIYWPAMIIVAGSAIVQYYQSKQLLPDSKDGRSLRTILKEAGTGKTADQTEVSAAVGRGMIFLLPVMIFFFTLHLPSGLGLYWLVGGIVAFLQQDYILRKDVDELEKDEGKKAVKNKSSDTKTKAVEGEVLPPKAPKAKPHTSRKKRRKK